jgi:hypothetical protein
MYGFAVEELTSVFRTLQAAGWDAVLVGGQAVNVWACRYEQDGRAWRELRPYTSRDLDYHGGLAEARLAMHLRMLVLIVRQWLREQLADPRKVFRAVERLAASTVSPDGLQAFAQGIDLAQALPLDDMRAAAGFAAFFEQRWPQLAEKITRKRERHLQALREPQA